MSKQSSRRKLMKLRSCLFNGQPLAIMPSAIRPMVDAFESHSLRELDAAMTFGRDVESTTRIINGVAVIPVTGVLRDECDWMVRCGYASSYQVIERELKKSLSDNQIKGVLFYFDTPGGSAIGCKRVADTIFELRGQKPIHGYVQGMCGSAGFYMLAACDRSDATADSLVGSIGTIYPHMEFSAAFEEMGIGATVFTNADSPKKGHGHPWQPLKTDAKKTLQEFTDSYGTAFIEDVARYKGISAAQVISKFGQGDAYRADIAVGKGMVDAIVANFSESLESISGISAVNPVEETESDDTPVVTGQLFSQEFKAMTVSKKIRAQLFASGLIENAEASDEVCTASLNAWLSAKGFADVNAKSEEAAILAAMQNPPQAKSDPVESDDDDDDDDDTETTTNKSGKGKPSNKKPAKPAENVQAARESEFGEARLADLKASAELVNSAAGYEAVTATMVLDAFEKKLDAKSAMKEWNAKIKENPIPASRVNVTGEGADQYAKDITDALVYRASNNRNMKLSDGAKLLTNRPLWVVAAECLRMSGRNDVTIEDSYGQREMYAEEAMQMGDNRRRTCYSEKEDRRYIQAGGNIPASRPGDFPNILSNLANKFLDTIELDDNYSYPAVSAVLPGGLNDFKPAMMVNKGIVEELDELADAESFKELGLQEEVLSYIFLRRFGNKFGWSPVLIANDDMNAFAEGMIGMAEAWQVTQNRLVVERYTSSETLLDGSALFANRANTGSGTNPATNDNDIDSGGAAPSDAQWILCENAYADIGGINTGRRVRGNLNVWFGPTGTATWEAVRTFAPLNQIGETKSADTTANVGLFRNKVLVVSESELRVASTLKWYALRSPTQLNTATVVRAYFNGFGTEGRRERWYDPENKTTWMSLEGRIAVAVKNWRYAVRNKGEA